MQELVKGLLIALLAVLIGCIISLSIMLGLEAVHLLSQL
jgi:hypothetical protein